MSEYLVSNIKSRSELPGVFGTYSLDATISATTRILSMMEELNFPMKVSLSWKFRNSSPLTRLPMERLQPSAEASGSCGARRTLDE